MTKLYDQTPLRVGYWLMVPFYVFSWMFLSHHTVRCNLGNDGNAEGLVFD